MTTAGSRRALEVFATSEYRAGRLTLAELGRLLDVTEPEAVRLLGPSSLLDRFRAFREGRMLGHPGAAALVREGRR